MRGEMKDLKERMVTWRCDASERWVAVDVEWRWRWRGRWEAE